MYIDINTLAETRAWRERILALLNYDPAAPFAPAEWDWFYLENPNGSPLISLFVDDDRVLGHYAIMPTRLVHGDRTLLGYRSMSTMVHPDARGRGLFTELAGRVYDMAAGAGASLVYGFPNKNSAPGFVKHLGWTLPPEDFVVDMTGDQIRRCAPLVASWEASSAVRWDYAAGKQLDWRTSRPGYRTTVAPGLIVKYFEGRPNILHIDERALTSLESEGTYRLPAPAHLRAMLGQHQVFGYQFGYRWFEPDGIDVFHRELILSDVF